MAYPTPAQIDAAVPVDGTPSRSLTNAALKNIVGAASYLPADGSVPTRSVANADFSGGRLKATPATDPDDCVTKVQLDQLKWGAIPDQPAVVAAGATQAAARTAIGAGTSNLAVGTTATTAAAGNHTHGAATATTAGFMSAADKAKLDALPSGGGAINPTAAPVITIGDPVDDENVQASFDALIAALKTAGVLT